MPLLEKMTICRFYNTPQGCRYGDSCKFEHVDESSGGDSGGDSDGSVLEFTMRNHALRVFCMTCGERCHYGNERCSKQHGRRHVIDWNIIQCSMCDFDLDPSDIDYPCDWPTPAFLWLQHCPNCNAPFHCATGNYYNVSLA